VKLTPKQIALAGLVAALYWVLTVASAPLSYGPVQFRISEALTVLPFFVPATIPGLFAGCLIANIFGPVGMLDIIFGPPITLLAALATRWLYHRTVPKGSVKMMWLAPLPPILFNAIGVAAYVAPAYHVNYWATAAWVLLGQTTVCYGGGLPLLFWVRSRRSFFD